MKRTLFGIAAVLFSLAISAQKDITSQYLANPSFENDNISSLSAVNNSADGLRGYTLTQPSGWTVSGADVTKLLVTKDCYTDNNFGKLNSIADGEKAYYLRMGWSTGTSSVTQNVTLPKGKYRLSVSQRAAYANSASSSLSVKGDGETTNVTFSAGSNGIMGTLPWTVSSVEFELDAQKTVTLGASVTWKSGGSCVALDNFKLYDITEEQVKEDPTEDEISSYTEGIITNEFVGEAAMKGDLLQMLANFSKYLVNDFQECAAPNSQNEACGAFKGENTMGANEQGVRPNADLSMICAFLVKYGKPAGVTLPNGVTWEKIEDMAMKSLVFAYSTHKANKLKVCSGNVYWGSTSTSDAVWESSLWAMSVAYSAFFQWNKLSEAQKNYIYKMLKAECNYELYRGIPTGYAGDTKAEENGWEADILAATLGLFPDDDLAPKWFARLREFAINSYSHPSDAANATVIDPEYDNVTVADLYKGQNLYDDYTLQNHNLFHTSYQNVVMQELGEAALALKMFQLGVKGEEKWKTNALKHHNKEVQDSVLNWLALADGELAMPNGNDWSLFLYDQITSYSTQACFERDANALMLENLAYKYIKARQKTTSDGSWLLRADVGARRMGVEAHRVMMTYLMHEMLSTADLTPTSWDSFRQQHAEARLLPCQNVVRAYTPKMFSCFSWSEGLKSYTGYFTNDKADRNKIIVPFRANNTGNIVGWYDVSGKNADASPVARGVYQFDGCSYVMNGELNTNGNSLNRRFAIYSTAEGALLYLDYVKANAACTINADKTGMLAISTDELMKTSRTLYYNSGDAVAHKNLDGAQFTSLSSKSPWVNIDNELTVYNINADRKVGFGERGANNSIYTSKLYPVYSNEPRAVKAGEVADRHAIVYFNGVTAEETMAMQTKQANGVISGLDEGWCGAFATESNAIYLLISNFNGQNSSTVKSLSVNGLAPVLKVSGDVNGESSNVKLDVIPNHSFAQPMNIFMKTKSTATAKQTDRYEMYVISDNDQTVDVAFLTDNSNWVKKENIAIKKGQTLRIWLNNNAEVCAESAAGFPESEETEASQIVNPSFEGDSSYGWEGTTPSFQQYTNAEFFSKTFDFH